MKKANESIEHKDKSYAELKEKHRVIKIDVAKKTKSYHEMKSSLEEMTQWNKEKELKIQTLCAQVATYRVGVHKKSTVVNAY